MKKDNQPIYETNQYGDKYWSLNGQFHREDGPAIEYINGNKRWFYHGEEINCSSQEEFKRLLKLKVLW